MKSTSASSGSSRPGIEPFLLGTALSAVSSIGYSCSNVCLRWLASCDPLLVSCIKAVPTMLVALALICLGIARGTIRWPSMGAFLGLACIGTIAQLGGNGLFQWSIGEVGLALTVPLCAGTMIVAACLLARVWLGEGVTPRSALALAILISAIAILSLGAERAPQVAELPNATAPITWALIAVCASGVAYATLNVTIRRLVTGAMQMPVVLATVSSMGVISLGLASTGRLGWEGVSATRLEDLAVMFLAGSFNAVGFFTLTKALQLVSIVQVNAVSASQSALAALAGVAMFGERLTVTLAIGVLLTIVGLTLVDRGQKVHPKRAAEQRPSRGTDHGSPQRDSLNRDTVEENEVVATPPLQLPGAASLPREPTTR